MRKKQENDRFYSNPEKDSFDPRKNKMRRTLGAILLGAATIFGVSTIFGCANPVQTVPSKKNEPPVITSYTIDPSSGDAPLNPEIKVTATDPDSNISTYNLVVKDKATGKTLEDETQSTSIFKTTLENAGDYSTFVTVTDGEGLTAKQEKDIIVKKASTPTPTPNPVGIIDFSSVENYLTNLKEGQTDQNIPLQRIDSKGNLVDYLDVTSSDPSIASAKYNGDGTFSITGESTSSDKPYDIIVSYKINGKTYSQTLEGELFDRPDFSGVLEDNKTNTPQEGTFVVSYMDKKGIKHFVTVNGTKNPASPNTTDTKGEPVLYTDANGNFAFKINDRTDDISEIDLEIGTGPYTTTPPSGFTGPYSGPADSWTRVRTTSPSSPGMPQTLALGDNKNLVVRAKTFKSVPLINGDRSYFENLMNQLNNPLWKYEVPNLFILANSPIDKGVMFNGSEGDNNTLLGLIYEKMQKLGGIIPGGLNIQVVQNLSDIGGTTSNGIVNYKKGYEIIVPVDYRNPILKGPGGNFNQGFTSRGGDTYGIISEAVSYIAANDPHSAIGGTAGVVQHEASGSEFARNEPNMADFPGLKSITFHVLNTLVPSETDASASDIVHGNGYKSLENMKYILKRGYVNYN